MCMCVCVCVCLIPLCLRRHFEGAVGGMACVFVPVLQVDAECVSPVGRECVQRAVAQPVFPLGPSEALPVLSPGAVKRLRAIQPVLEHRPASAVGHHVTHSLSHTAYTHSHSHNHSSKHQMG